VSLATSSDEDTSVFVIPRNFASDEVVLPYSCSTFPHSLAKFSHGIDCNLCGFVNTVSVDVKHHDCKTRECLNLLSHRRNPVSEAILNARGFR